VAAEVVRVIRVIDGWREHFAACGVTNADLESLAARIDGEALRGQRAAFDPADYPASRTPKRKRPLVR
jgi:serine/threonine-protein kinase HipA